jgi:hypothetical protein
MAIKIYKAVNRSTYKAVSYRESELPPIRRVKTFEPLRTRPVIDYGAVALARSKRAVRTYIDNNVWSHMVTITFDDDKLGFSSVDVARTFDEFRRVFRNYGRGRSLRYVFVPELHKSGRLHLHGVIWIPPEITLKYITFDQKKQYKVYRADYLFDKLGANRFVPIAQYSVAIRDYITDYMTKSLIDTPIKQYYFASRGLQGDVVVFKETASGDYPETALHYMGLHPFRKVSKQSFEYSQYSLTKEQVDSLKDEILLYHVRRFHCIIPPDDSQSLQSLQN